jgi:hypothetical protein
MNYLLLIALLLVVILWLRSRGSEEHEHRADRKALKRKLARKRELGTQPHSPYRAVSIKRGAGACQAVKALSGERFLVREAPITPLPECNSAHCQCRYAHHEDRRRHAGDRRVIGNGASSGNVYQLKGRPERRERQVARRQEDREEYALA